MPKEYEYICLGCRSVFATIMKDRAFCRACIASGVASLKPKPMPTQRQAAKWAEARKMKRLVDERNIKIKNWDDQVAAVKAAKAGDIITFEEE